MMFAVLFGLSMDYEVFLISRVREAFDGGHDTTGAITEGPRGPRAAIEPARP